MGSNFNKLISSVEKIISLSKEEKLTVISLFEIDSINRKKLLLDEGEVCKYEHFVLEGCLRSYYINEDFNEHTTMFAIEGWWTGNLKSFVRSSPSEFSIQALEDTIIAKIHKNRIEELYSEIPKFERYFRILLQNRLLATQDRVGYHLSTSASERYIQFITKYPEIEKRVPLKHIASYLGITPTYLSRLRRRRMQSNFLQ